MDTLVGLILTCSNVTCICLAGVGYQPLFSCGNSFVLANINLDGQKLWHQTQHLSLTWESSLLIYQVIPTIIKYTTPTKTNILCPKLLVWFRWFSWWTMLGFIVGGFKYFVSFPRNMVKRLPRSKTSILFRLRWVARTPTYYDKHQLHLCHSVVWLFFWYGMYRKQGWFTNPQQVNGIAGLLMYMHLGPHEKTQTKRPESVELGKSEMEGCWRRGRFVEHSSIRQSGVKVDRGRKTRPGPQKMPASKGNQGGWNVIIWPSKGFFCWLPS